MAERKLVDKVYDVIIIGGGPGGMTAALYASRSNLDTLILEKGLPGGELNNTDTIENYPGVSAIKGPDLAVKMFEDATAFGADHKMEAVQEVDFSAEVKRVYTRKHIYQALAVIIATGSENRKLGVPGEEDFQGRGVSYCAVCDGAFYKDKNIAVVGGGDSAVEEGTYLTQFADQVTIIHRRDQLRAQPLLQERAFSNDKVNFIWDSTVEEIEGEGQVTALAVKNVKSGELEEVPFDGVFVYVGILPNTEFLDGTGILNAEGWVETDQYMRTSIPGVYAIGDVRDTPLRQVATAVGDGALAGQDAFQYIQALKD